MKKRKDKNQDNSATSRLPWRLQKLRKPSPVPREPKAWKDVVGIERLRAAVRLLDNCRESFVTQFSAVQCLSLHDAYNRSEWDIPPDRWTRRQVQEAIRGRAPTWDADETPTYEAP